MIIRSPNDPHNTEEQRALEETAQVDLEGQTDPTPQP